MHFSLINVGATFKRSMDITFIGLINTYVVVYLDDITMYSKNWNDHTPHLKEIFERCRRYEILLNPKKSIFAIEKGTLLGFVISPDGIIIDPKRIESINNIVLLHNKRAIQSFVKSTSCIDLFLTLMSL